MSESLKRYKWTWSALILFVIGILIPNHLIGLAITGILALFTLWKPKDGLLFLLIYFPTRPFLMEINPSLKAVGDVLIVAAFIHVVLKGLKDWKSLFRFQLFEWAFIVFLIVGSGAAFITGVHLSAIIFQIRAFVITFLLIYIVRRLSITKEDILKFLWITFITAVVLSIHGIIEKLSLRSMLMPEKWMQRALSYNNRTRVYGLTNNPNVLAVYLSLAFMTTLYLQKLVSDKLKWIFYVGMVLILGTWTLTYSRGTWVALIIGLVVYMIVSRDWKKLSKIIIMLAIAVLIINLPVAKIARDYYAAKQQSGQINQQTQTTVDPNESFEQRRMQETFDPGTLQLSKDTGRLFVIKKGFEIFKDHPIIGTGFSTYGDSASKSYASPIYKHYKIGFNIYADDQYIIVIAETGVIGVILFAIFLLGMLWFMWKHRQDSVISIPLAAVLVGILWCGFIYNIWEDKTFTTYFFMMVGILVNQIYRKEEITE